MLLSSVVVVGTGGPWESESNEGITIWHLAAVACLGSSSSHNNTGLAAVACRSSSSNSSCNTGLATVGFLTSTNEGPMLSLPLGKRDNRNYYSYRHGESIRQEVTGSTAGTPFHHLRLKRCPTPVFSPLRLRRLWRKRPRHQRARHRRQYLQQRRPTGGTVFPTTSVGGAARAPAPADETAASKAASTASGTVPSATPLREAVGARESSAGTESSDAVSKAASTASGTVPSATPLREAVRARDSSAGVASSDAVSKAAPAASGTVTSATPLRGAVGARESSSGAAPSDVAAEAFPLAVRYNNNSSNSSNNIISSSNSRGNGSSCSSNDTTSNHDPWWEATYVGALLRPFDPGKGCQRDARIGVILGLDLPFDRGKA